MNELSLIKSAEFGDIQCDFYGKDNEVYMTINQLAACLGYLVHPVSICVSRARVCGWQKKVLWGAPETSNMSSDRITNIPVW